jgi:hypothetical protein
VVDQVDKHMAAVVPREVVHVRFERRRLLYAFRACAVR